MFDNIGQKIMKLAKVICCIGIILSVLSGIIMMVSGSRNSYGYSTGPNIIGGLLTIVLGSLGSWVGSFFTYGFGQLIENTDSIRYYSQHKEQ